MHKQWYNHSTVQCLPGLEWKCDTYIDQALPLTLYTAPKLYTVVTDFVNRNPTATAKVKPAEGFSPKMTEKPQCDKTPVSIPI